MRIENADWDSNFFDLKIGKCCLDIKETEEVIYNFDHSSYDLIYLFFSCLFPKEMLYLFSEHQIYVDERVNYEKVLKRIQISNSFSFEALESKHNKLLLDITYQIGEYSRFKHDIRLNSKFRELYSLWLRNSLDKKIADDVYGLIVNKKVVGYVSMKKTEDIAKVGLIGVDEKYRGLGYGKMLLNYAENRLFEEDIKYLFIPTQLENKISNSFYKKMNYEVSSYETIVHLWRK